MEVVTGKKTVKQEAGSGSTNSTVVSISENMLAGIHLGGIALGKQVAGLLEVCKAVPRLVTAGNTSANIEDNTTSGSLLGRAVVEEVELAQLVEGLAAAACSR